MQIAYHPAADSELSHEAQFYEKRVPGLGAAFLDEVESAVQFLRTSPELFSLHSDGTRHCPIRRFPQRLIYRVELDRIRIYAVAHPKQRPNYWLSRLEE